MTVTVPETGGKKPKKKSPKKSSRTSGKKPQSVQTTTSGGTTGTSPGQSAPSNPAPISTGTTGTGTTTAPPTTAPTGNDTWKKRNIGLSSDLGKRPGKARKSGGREEEKEETNAPETSEQFKKKSSQFSEVGKPEQEKPTWKYDKSKESKKEVTNESSNGSMWTGSSDELGGGKAKGAFTGTTTKQSDSVTSGMSRSQESSSLTSSGGTVTETKTERKELVGAQASLEQVLTKYSNGDIKATFEACARAGAFGEAMAQGAKKKGNFSAYGKATGKAKAGVEATAGGSAEIKAGRFIPEIALALEAAVMAGVSLEASLEGGVKYGPVALKLLLELEAWAGAKANVEMKAFFNKAEGIGAEISAEASAGAGAEANATGSLDFGKLIGFDGTAGVYAFAGATAKFEGGVQVNLTNVKIAFEASAFAGARAGINAGAGLRIRGRKVLSMSGNFEVSAGVGGKAKAKIGWGAGAGIKDGVSSNGRYSESGFQAKSYSDSFDNDYTGPFEVDQNGTLDFGVGLGGALGLGAGVDIDGSLDIAAIEQIIAAEIYEHTKSDSDKKYDSMGAQFDRVDLPPESPMAKRYRAKGYNAVFPSFKEYADKKTLQGDNGVKEGRIREMVKEMMPMYRGYLAYREFDQGMEDAAYAAFRGYLKNIEFDAGTVKAIELMDYGPEMQGERARMAEEEGWAKARDALQNDFVKVAMGLEKSKAADGAAAKKQLQDAITKRKPSIEKAFAGKLPAGTSGPTKPTATLSEVATFAAREAHLVADKPEDSLFTDWKVDDKGLLDPATALNTTRLGKVQKDFQTVELANKANKALFAVKTDVAKAVSETVDGKRKPPLNDAELKKLVAARMGELPAEVKEHPQVNAMLQAILAPSGKQPTTPSPGQGPSESGKGEKEVSTAKGVLEGIMEVEVEKGAVASSRLVAGGWEKKRAEKTEATTKTQRTAAINAFMAELGAYKDKKSAGSTDYGPLIHRNVHGVKAERIDEIIARNFKSFATDLKDGKLDTELEDRINYILEISEMARGNQGGSKDAGAVVTKGKVSLPNLLETRTQKEKQANKEFGQQTLFDERTFGGDQTNGKLDNVRRQDVHRVIREPLDNYRAELEATLTAKDEKGQWKATKPAFDMARLTAAIDLVKKKVGNNVRGEVGDTAIKSEITKRFGDILDGIEVKNFALGTGIKTKENWILEVRKKVLLDKISNEGVDAIRAEVGDLYFISKRKDKVEEILKKYWSKVPGVGEEKIAKAKAAVVQARLAKGDTFKELEIDKSGHITKYKVM